MSLPTDPASFCFLIEVERVNLAEPGGLAKPRLPLPLEAMLVGNLVTWGCKPVKFAVVSHTGAGDGACVAWGVPPRGSMLEL
jgi:hypothetical protein